MKTIFRFLIYSLFAVIFLMFGKISQVPAMENPIGVADEQLKFQHKSKNNFFRNIHGFVDVNGYYDTRSLDVLTVNTLINFPCRIQYFSFINTFGNSGTATMVSLNRYFTEQNLRYISQTTPVDIGGQWVFGNNGFKDLMRFGSRWRVADTPRLGKYLKKLHLIYEPSFFPLQIDQSRGYDAQIEHFYRIQVFPKLFGDRVYISGFVDHNFLFGSDNRNDHNVIVTENQIGVRIVKQLYIVAEHRFYEFLKSKRQGLGIGLEYSLGF